MTATTNPHILEQIPPHILHTVHAMAQQITDFNASILRMRALDARFGSPGRYERDVRDEKEAFLHQHALAYLARFEPVARAKGIDPQDVYTALGVDSTLLPWSDAARHWR